MILTLVYEGPNVSLALNRVPVDSTNSVDVTGLVGINEVSITNTNDQTVKITDVLLDNVSIGNCLFLAYLKNPNRSGTWIPPGETVYLPIGFPFAWWSAKVAQTIPNSAFGSDLYANQDIYYPESVDVGDYFKYDFGFTVVPHTKDPLHNLQVPWIKINLDYNEDLLLNEFKANHHLLQANDYHHKQNNKTWEVALTTKGKEKKYSAEDFPNLDQLLTSISQRPDVEVLHSFVGMLEPGGKVLPHRDDHKNSNTSEYHSTEGLCQIFIPIGWKTGNWYKFSEVGLLDYTQGAWITNNHTYTHGSINLSDSVRYTIGLFCKFKNNDIIV